ncbi:Protein translocase subunit SecF [hydrothermal vent metagenome]|uniref:Protein translocase subunit SecF n=1 Tax=hydrothermal vent metagenome TaxID=652676 RepID=A0A3B1C3I3_9ZZZZ
MRMIESKTNINFLGQRRVCAMISAALIIVAITSLVWHGGPNYGIDFRGGALIQLKFTKAAPLPEVRKVISRLKIGDFSIQEFGAPDEFLIRVQQTSNDKGENTQAQEVEAALREKYGKNFIVERVEMVGPKVGADLREKAFLALFYSLVGILIYITLRFELRFGVAAIVALGHDTMITVGAFSLMDKEFTLTVIAALLTVIGYSLNDTIVIFDRIRENLRLKRGQGLESILNTSINQTLSRTILTSSTTLVVVLSIFILGGEVIHDFAFALLVGIVVGTYSSIYVASPIILLWSEWSKRKIPEKTAPSKRSSKRKSKI